MRRYIILLVTLPLAVAVGSSLSHGKTWTDQNGRQVEADFISSQGDKVVIKRESDGRLFLISLDLLSDGDQDFVKSHTGRSNATPRAIPPKWHEQDAQVKAAYTEFIVRVGQLAQDADTSDSTYDLDNAIAQEYRLLDGVWKAACKSAAKEIAPDSSTGIAELAANWLLNCKTADQDAIAAIKASSPLPSYDDSLLQDVRTALADRPESTVLVHYFYHKESDIAFAGDNPEREHVFRDFAAAWLIPPAGHGSVRVVGLHDYDERSGNESTSQLATYLSTLRGVIRNDETAIIRSQRLSLNSLDAFVSSMQSLREVLIDPLAKGGAIYSYRHWIVAPVADLWLIPFSAMPLPTEERANPRQFYCIERFKISYSLSGKYLVHSPSPSRMKEHAKPVVLASPNFNAEIVRQSSVNHAQSNQHATLVRVEVTTNDRISARIASTPRVGNPVAMLHRTRAGWSPSCIPTHSHRWIATKHCGWRALCMGATNGSNNEGALGTGLERDFTPLNPRFNELADNVGRRIGLMPNDANRLLGTNATERRLVSGMQVPGEAVHKPITVICTHGFFLFEGWNPSVQDPLMRCGLALTGANPTRRAGTLFTLHPNDGILYGREIAGLDLSGTDTVVLVACQSGVGEVFGGTLASLRHAFTIAGVNKVVGTSWTVSAEHSRWFLQHLFNELGIKQAPTYDDVHESQIKMIAQLSRGRTSNRMAHPMYWASFSLTGETGN